MASEFVENATDDDSVENSEQLVKPAVDSNDAASPQLTQTAILQETSPASPTDNESVNYRSATKRTISVGETGKWRPNVRQTTADRNTFTVSTSPAGIQDCNAAHCAYRDPPFNEECCDTGERFHGSTQRPTFLNDAATFQISRNTVDGSHLAQTSGSTERCVPLCGERHIGRSVFFGADFSQISMSGENLEPLCTAKSAFAATVNTQQNALSSSAVCAHETPKENRDHKKDQGSSKLKGPPTKPKPNHKISKDLNTEVPPSVAKFRSSDSNTPSETSRQHDDVPEQMKLITLGPEADCIKSEVQIDKSAANEDVLPAAVQSSQIDRNVCPTQHKEMNIKETTFIDLTPPAQQEINGSTPTRTPSLIVCTKLASSDSFSSSCSHRLLRTRTKNTLSLQEYYRIRQIIPTPVVSPADLDATFHKRVFRYLLQCVKFGGCSALSATRISALVQQQSTTAIAHIESSTGARRRRTPKRQETTADERIHPVSKLDCVNYLLTKVDKAVASELLLIMSQFQMALPLVTYDHISAGAYHVFLPLHRGIPLKWETSPGKVVEHSLFINGCKMVVAVRLGSNHKGKSAILNQLLAKEFTFSSKEESIYGKPHSLNGCVEMIWLTQETCKRTFWDEVLKEHYNSDRNEILILANLHGNALDHRDLVRFLDEFFLCSFLVFAMPDCTDKMWDDFNALLINPQKMVDVNVENPGDVSDDPMCINTGDITADNTMRKVRNVMKKLLTSEEVSPTTVINLGTKECDDKHLQIRFLPAVVNGVPSKLLELVTDHSCQQIKSAILAFINTANQSQQGSSSSSTLTNDELLHEIVSHFTDVLCQQSEDDVHQSMIHLEKELSRLSSNETQEARTRLYDLQTKRRSLRENSTKQPDLNRDIGKETKKVENSRLGVEHFFRLLGHIYETSVTKADNRDVSKQWSRSLNTILTIPEKVASLLLRGQPIELLNGDSGIISGVRLVNLVLESLLI